MGEINSNSNSQNSESLFELAQIELCRDNLNSNLLLKVKASSKFWGPIKLASDEIINYYGVTCFRSARSELKHISALFSRERPLVSSDGDINLQFLLATDIESGVTFNFGVVPISEEGIVTLIQRIYFEIKNFYFNYLKPIDIKVRITSSVVDTQECY